LPLDAMSPRGAFAPNSDRKAQADSFAYTDLVARSLVLNLCRQTSPGTKLLSAGSFNRSHRCRQVVARW